MVFVSAVVTSPALLQSKIQVYIGDQYTSIRLKIYFDLN